MSGGLLSGPGVGADAEYLLRSASEYGGPLRGRERRLLEQALGLGVPDRERLIGTQHDAVRAGLLAEELERVGVEHAGIEVHARESLARVRELSLGNRVVPSEPAERVGKRRAAVRQHELHSRELEEVAGKQH